MIVGFCGLAGAGKTTAAGILVAELGYRRIAFADPLKAMARAFGLGPRELSGDLKEAPCDLLCGRTPRQFMQMLGTEFGRDMIGTDLWLRSWRRSVEAVIASEGHNLIVADDVRFPQEADAIRSMGGIVVRIERMGAGSASGGSHPSETTPIAVDATIVNDGDEATLRRALKTYLTEYS